MADEAIEQKHIHLWHIWHIHIGIYIYECEKALNKVSHEALKSAYLRERGLMHY